MGVPTYTLLLWLWFCHIGIGLVMLLWGFLHRHWAGPAVLWPTKSAAGWYLHHRVPYLVVVPAFHAGAGLAWVSGSDCCHWAHLLLMGVPHSPQNAVPLVVFAGPVDCDWTENMTGTELNPTAKDWTSSCSCTDSENFQLLVQRFDKKIERLKKTSSNQLQPVFSQYIQSTVIYTKTYV